jgi:hypothetical protein
LTAPCGSADNSSDVDRFIEIGFTYMVDDTAIGFVSVGILDDESWHLSDSIQENGTSLSASAPCRFNWRSGVSLAPMAGHCFDQANQDAE